MSGVITGSLLIQIHDFSFNFSISYFSLTFTIFYCWIIGIIFREEILPVITERSLHITSLIYLYNVIVLSDGKFQIFLIVISIIPLGAVLYYAIVNYKLSKKIQVYLYYWYLAMLIIIQVLNFMIFKNQKLVVGWLDVSDFINVFFLSGVFFYIIIYGINAFAVFMADTEDEESIKRMIEEQEELFTSKFSDYQASPIGTIILTLVVVILIILNFNYKIIEPILLGQIILIIALIMTSLGNIIVNYFPYQR
ncbi:MAG: hypothetical protein ACOCVN_00360 [bacterium]